MAGRLLRLGSLVIDEALIDEVTVVGTAAGKVTRAELRLVPGELVFEGEDARELALWQRDRHDHRAGDDFQSYLAAQFAEEDAAR